MVGTIQILYLFALHREKQRRGDGKPVARRGQVVAFSAGVAVLFVASYWPVHDLAERYLYSVHMVQHMLFTLGAAALLLMGTPAWLARRLLAPTWLLGTVRSLSKPLVALIQFNVVIVLSHWPAVVDATVRHHPLHFVAHAVLLVSALLMWMPVLSPLGEVPRAKPLMQMLYLFLQTVVPTIPASFLTFGKTPLYKVYETFPRLWGISVLDDQLTAGLIMKLAGGLFLWTVIAIVFFRWYAAEDAREREAKRRGGDDVLLWTDVEHELAQLDETTTPP